MYPSSLFQHTQYITFPALPSFAINLTVLNLHIIFSVLLFLSLVSEYFLHQPQATFFTLLETKFQSDIKQLAKLRMIMDIYIYIMYILNVSILFILGNKQNTLIC